MSVDNGMNRRLKFALLAYQVGIALLVLKPLLIIFGLRFNAHEWLADFPYRMVAGKIEPTINVERCKRSRDAQCDAFT